MDRYIGLDVHMQSCTMGVLGPSGKRLKLEVIPTNAEALIEAVRKIRGRLHLCIEEGTLSAWLYEILEPHVDELVVTVPRASSGQKSDARDAFGLAEMLRRNAIDIRVYKAPPNSSGLRDAVRGYGMVTQDVIRVKNRLKSVFRARGLHGMCNELYQESKRPSWIEKLPPSHGQLASLLGQELDGILTIQREALTRMESEAKQNPIVRRLTTAPGIGPIRAAQIVSIVVTPHRFRTKQQFWSYCGLAIVTRSSADWVRTGNTWERAMKAQTRGLNRNRQPLLKEVFKGAAHTVATVLTDHPLHRDYQQMLQGGIKPNLAMLTLARRIASAVLAMWKRQEDYDPAKHQRKIAA
jgi:transposase